MSEKKKSVTADTPPETQNPTAPVKQQKRVEIICDGVLGNKLLRKGDVTDDADYTALLDTERGKTLVREVK